MYQTTGAHFHAREHNLATEDQAYKKITTDYVLSQAHTGICQNKGNTNIKCLKRVLGENELPEKLQCALA